MHQVWFLVADVKPREAVNQGLDEAVCGDCKLRNGPCYVRVDQAPRQIWEYETNKGYALEPDYGKRNVPTRLGAYGEPTSVPFETIQKLLAGRPGHTGYTHRWRTCDQRFKSILMASCDTEEEAEEAKAMGWRYFFVDHVGDHKLRPNEVSCPASKEMGYRTTCDKCLLCSGANKIAKDVVIIEH
jgi:hypothetical protein